MHLSGIASRPDGKSMAGGPARAMRLIGFTAAILLYLVSVTTTVSSSLGDTMGYSSQIVDVRNGAGTYPSLWEFGHILWRPLGYALFSPFTHWIPDSVAWNPVLKVAFGLGLVSFVAGLICTLVVYDLAYRLIKRAGPALLCSLILVWANGFLTYATAGCPYIPGLALLLAGLWCQLVPSSSGVKTVIGSSCLYGLAVLAWTPYLFAIPAACCARMWLRFPPEDRAPWKWSHVILSGFAAGMIVLAGVGVAASLAGVHDLPQMKQWITDSSHLMRQNRTLVRAVSGVTRLLVALGPDSVYMKRFALQDPYSPVRAADLVVRLWKLVLFYGFVAALMALVWKSTARRALLLLLVSGGLGLFAGIVMFEPSSPERLLPVLPFLLLVLAAGWNSRWRRAGLLRLAVGAISVVIVAVNLVAFEPALSAEYRQAKAQVKDLREFARHDDDMVAMTPVEPVIVWVSGHPFDRAARTGVLRVDWAVNPIDGDVANWSNRFAKRALDSWNCGWEVWVEKSALGSRPNAGSLWVEGDNPVIHWRDIPAFFGGFDFDIQTRRPDGFMRLAHTPQNQSRLVELVNARPTAQYAISCYLGSR